MGLSVLHVRAPMYTTTKDDGVRNGYTLRFSNKWSEPRKFAIEVAGLNGASIKSVEADALPDGRLVVSVDPDATLEVAALRHRSPIRAREREPADRRQGDRPNERRERLRERSFFRAVKVG